MKLGVKEILFVCVMLGLLGCTYAFVFKQANEKRELKTQKIESRERDLENLRRSTAGIEDLEAKIADLQKAIDFFESKLPQEKEVDKILREVWQMAEANSLQTRTVKTLRSVHAAYYSEQPIQMTLAGDFNGFYAFLLQLEKLPRITRIQKMTLDRADKADGVIIAEITLSIFFEPENGSSATASLK